MAKIADDLHIEYTTVKIPLDEADGPSLPDIYLYVRDGREFPENFSIEDRWLAMQLLMWGECEERPRKRVLKFIADSKKLNQKDALNQEKRVEPDGTTP